MRSRGPWLGAAVAVAATWASPITGWTGATSPATAAAESGRGAVAGGASRQSGGCEVTTDLRLDHVPIAVRDLEVAGELFRSLGFTLKPGRPHANGIANLHAKFADGTELELITAAEAVDAITRGYVEFLRDGDGAAYLALHAGPLDEVESRLGPIAPGLLRAPGMLAFPAAHRWGSYFFGQLNRSPTDRPEHFEHANGARGLAAVWLADDELAGLLGTFDALPCGTVELRSTMRGRVVPLAAGSAVVLLPGETRLRPSRPIVGVTVRVDDVDVASELLDAAAVPYSLRTVGPARSLLIDPAVAPGLWIELRAGVAWRP